MENKMETIDKQQHILDLEDVIYDLADVIVAVEAEELSCSETANLLKALKEVYTIKLNDAIKELKDELHT